jgi:hypothetical protein
MTNSPSRHILEADLLRYQEANDYASQAETLMRLAELAKEEEAFRLAHGLYGQAWGAYEHIGHKGGSARVIVAIISILPNVLWDEERGTDESWVDLAFLYDMALTLYIELGDQRETANIYAAMGCSRIYPDDISTHFLQQALSLYEYLDDMPEQMFVLQTLFYHYVFDTPDYWQCIDRALKLYRAIGDKTGELGFLGLVYQYRFDDPKVQPFIERAFELYRQLEDTRGEANLYVEIGIASHRDEHYDAAKSALETALRLFMEIGFYDRALSTRFHMARVIAASDGYEAYLRYHQDTLQQFRTLPVNRYFLFKQFYETAYDHKDFATARHGFQQAIAASWDNQERQAEHYWEWGRMEAYEMGNTHMGFMLCQWAVTLFDQCLPGQNRYHKKLRQMRREMNPSQYKWSKS